MSEEEIKIIIFVLCILPLLFGGIQGGHTPEQVKFPGDKEGEE